MNSRNVNEAVTEFLWDDRRMSSTVVFHASRPSDFDELYTRDEQELHILLLKQGLDLNSEHPKVELDRAGLSIQLII